MKKQKSFTQYHFSSKSDGKGLPSTIFRGKSGAGFTLIEILIVIAILGILVTIVTAIGLKGRERARRAATLQFSATIHNVLGAYLVGEWKFDNDTADDSSGNGNNGTLKGGAAFADGIIKRALTLDGSGDYVEIPNSDSLDVTNKLTIEAWIKTDEFGGSESWMVVSKASSYLLWYYQGSLRFYSYGTTDPYTIYTPSSNPFIVGKWNHYLGTYDGSENKIYVNGKEIYSFTNSGNITINTNPLRLGTYMGASYFFDGLIDEVRIYEEALTSAQIQKLYVEGAEKHGLLVKE